MQTGSVRGIVMQVMQPNVGVFVAQESLFVSGNATPEQREMIQRTEKKGLIERGASTECMKGRGWFRTKAQ